MSKEEDREEALKGALGTLASWESEMKALRDKPPEELNDVERWRVREYERAQKLAKNGKVDERFVRADGSEEVIAPLHHT